MSGRSGYEQARARFAAAVARGDRLEAEWELSEMKAANEELEAEVFADRFVRDLEAWGRES